jgi:hypothetical protein
MSNNFKYILIAVVAAAIGYFIAKNYKEVKK